MKITEQHHQRVPNLAKLTKKLNPEQTQLLEALLDVVHRDGQSAGYRVGNPDWDED